MKSETSILDKNMQQSNMREETPLLSEELVQQLNPLTIPKHVAFIPDGNRRWAKKQRILPEQGHQIGAEILMNIVRSANQMGIETLTFFIFSTENWQRPRHEIKAQMWLLEKSLIEQKKRMVANGVRFLTIGELSKFPPKIVQLIEETKEATKDCDKINVVFAMNYGGRDDIQRAFQKMLADVEIGTLKREEISEDTISQYLDTSEWKDPDLLIRTSGEFRISNFLLWQLSYTEIYLSNEYWPEFTPQHFFEAIRDYQQRDRRMGGS